MSELEPKTAISYRREDTSGWARGLYDKLSDAFGDDRVFIDFDGIGSGEDFENTIIATINGSDVLLALIGKRWLDAVDENGHRRLDDLNDTVRVEIRTGLDKGSVIPVLVDGAGMPKVRGLPADIQKLARLNAHVIGLRSFHRDGDELVEEIRLQTRLLREKRESVSPEARIHALEEELTRARAELEAARRDTAQPQTPRRPFDAFLVYSHSDGGRLAAVLQRSLEAHPAVEGRKLRVFRDTTDLAASPSLMTNIREMVDNSEFLILLASPRAAQSRWVDAELSYFLESRPRDRVLMVLAEGEPDSSIPPVLRSTFEEDMPLFVDLRGVGDGTGVARHPHYRLGVARLVAALQSVALDDVVNRRGRQRKRRIRAMVVAAVVLAATALAIYWGLTSR